LSWSLQTHIETMATFTGLDTNKIPLQNALNIPHNTINEIQHVNKLHNRKLTLIASYQNHKSILYNNKMMSQRTSHTISHI